MKLTREIRGFIRSDGQDQPVVNGWAGWPGGDAPAPYVVLRAQVEGRPDPRTGYLCDIGVIDRVLRARAWPVLTDFFRRHGDSRSAAHVTPALFNEVVQACPPGARLNQLEMAISPHTSFCLRAEDTDMIRMTHSFEFSAAHRLYLPELSETENLELFGKCANPNGHGHNYVLDVTVGGAVSGPAGVLLPAGRLDRIVRERILARFDHKHLNEDCAEFTDLNPSVENIAKVLWSLLVGALGESRLLTVRLWETPKTCVEYDGRE